MPRRKRCYLPGTAFHLVARTNRGEEFFNSPERFGFVVAAIDRSVRKTDASLYAYGIMSNHIHLVIRQGVGSIAQLMHPLLREVARAVHRWETGTGHIFSRPFYESPCSDPDYLRRIIAYVNRNAERARLCKDPIEYHWTSHAEYSRQMVAGRIRSTELISMAPLFSAGNGKGSDVEGYLAYLEWCRHCEELPEGVKRPPPPRMPAGDQHWLQHFRSAPVTEHRVVQDLRDIALQTLKQNAPGLSVEQLRLRRRNVRIVKVRTEIIQRAVKAGHRNVDIAQYLDVSQTTVSRVACKLVQRPPVRFT